jgi:ATP-dependent Clp endopeptidase proteolytic subunit ClpP
MKWYEIKAKADKAEIWIYEMIGEDFWTGGGVTAKNFQKELAEIKASQIDLHINSPGGVVFDGITIYNLIKQHPANVTTYIDGLAASIASVIALAGNKVIMAENALYMIHNPTGLAMGTATDMRSLADILDKIAGTMITTYSTKSKKPEEEIKAMLEVETWMTADEAKEAGFIDEIAGEMDMAACAKFVPVMAKAGFKHIPKSLNGSKELPSERDLERILRDAGCSREQAKSILAKGYTGDLRDADLPPNAPPAKETPRDADPPAPARKDRWDQLYLKAERQVPSTN